LLNSTDLATRPWPLVDDVELNLLTANLTTTDVTTGKADGTDAQDQATGNSRLELQ
jgi:hypothetical protein